MATAHRYEEESAEEMVEQVVMQEQPVAQTWILRFMLWLMVATARPLIAVQKYFFKKIFFTHPAFDLFCKTARSMRRAATSSTALDMVYDHCVHKADGPTMAAVAKWYYNHLNTVIGGRNRLTLVRKEILDSIYHFVSQGKEEINVLSVACGSARAVLDAAKLVQDIKVNIYLVDWNEESLQSARAYATELGIADQLQTKKCYANRAVTWLQLQQGVQAHIVEVCGLIDYFTEEKTVELLALFGQVLAPNGRLITSQVAPTPEKEFLEVVVGWIGMYYRSLEQFQPLVEKAGYECRAYYDDTDTQVIAVGTRLQ